MKAYFLGLVDRRQDPNKSAITSHYTLPFIQAPALLTRKRMALAMLDLQGVLPGQSLCPNKLVLSVLVIPQYYNAILEFEVSQLQHCQ